MSVTDEAASAFARFLELPHDARLHAFAHDTEVSAALLNRVSRASTRRKVLLSLHVAGEYGRTDYELEQQLQVPRPSPGNRRGDLVEWGLAVETPDRRPTWSGAPAIVWKLTDLGHAVAEVVIRERDAGR